MGMAFMKVLPILCFQNCVVWSKRVLSKLTENLMNQKKHVVFLKKVL